MGMASPASDDPYGELVIGHGNGEPITVPSITDSLRRMKAIGWVADNGMFGACDGYHMIELQDGSFTWEKDSE